MTYLHDPENPFRKILVKDGSNTVGVIRRNLNTGHYQFYDSKENSMTPLYKVDRLDRMKLWVDGRYAAA